MCEILSVYVYVDVQCRPDYLSSLVVSHRTTAPVVWIFLSLLTTCFTDLDSLNRRRLGEAEIAGGFSMAEKDFEREE